MSARFMFDDQAIPDVPAQCVQKFMVLVQVDFLYKSDLNFIWEFYIIFLYLEHYLEQSRHDKM